MTKTSRLVVMRFVINEFRTIFTIIKNFLLMLYVSIKIKPNEFQV